jgi:hypothetical protein
MNTQQTAMVDSLQIVAESRRCALAPEVWTEYAKEDTAVSDQALVNINENTSAGAAAARPVEGGGGRKLLNDLS